MQKINKKYLVLVIFAVFFATIFISGAVVAKSENAGGANTNKSSVSPGASFDTSALPSASASPSSDASSASKNTGQTNAEKHRSVVSGFVQSLVRVADQDNSIGEQVRLIAREQNQAATTTVQAMERVQTRSKIKTFLLGTDYKNLGALRSEMVQTQNRLAQLANLTIKTKNASSATEIQSQVQVLEQEQLKIENFIKTQESKFSLFGWLVKLLNK